MECINYFAMRAVDSCMLVRRMTGLFHEAVQEDVEVRMMGLPGRVRLSERLGN